MNLTSADKLKRRIAQSRRQEKEMVATQKLGSFVSLYVMPFISRKRRERRRLVREEEKKKLEEFNNTNNNI